MWESNWRCLSARPNSVRILWIMYKWSVISLPLVFTQTLLCSLMSEELSSWNIDSAAHQNFNFRKCGHEFNTEYMGKLKLKKKKKGCAGHKKIFLFIEILTIVCSSNHEVVTWIKVNFWFRCRVNGKLS